VGVACGLVCAMAATAALLLGALARNLMVAVRWVDRSSIFGWSLTVVFIVNWSLVFLPFEDVQCCGASTGIVANVCASAVARFRSRVLSPTQNVERRYKLWITPHRTIEETFCWQP
jgi:hypothetical protein